MAYEIRPETGSLFVNDKREKETHPNAKGSALIGGIEYWVSAWTKTTSDGRKWQSLSFTPKEKQFENVQQPPEPMALEGDPIPF